MHKRRVTVVWVLLVSLVVASVVGVFLFKREHPRRPHVVRQGREAARERGPALASDDADALGSDVTELQHVDSSINSLAPAPGDRRFDMWLKLPSEREDEASIVPGFPFTEIGLAEPLTKVSPDGKILMIRGGFAKDELAFYDVDNDLWLAHAGVATDSSSITSWYWLDQDTVVYTDMGMSDDRGGIGMRLNVRSGARSLIPVPAWLEFKKPASYVFRLVPVRNGSFSILSVKNPDGLGEDLYLIDSGGNLISDMTSLRPPDRYAQTMFSKSGDGSKVFVQLFTHTDEAGGATDLMLLEFAEDGDYQVRRIDNPEILPRSEDDMFKFYQLSPSGEYVTFQSLGDAWREVFLYDFESAEVRQLTNGGGHGGSMDDSGDLYFTCMLKDRQEDALFHLSVFD